MTSDSVDVPRYDDVYNMVGGITVRYTVGYRPSVHSGDEFITLALQLLA